MVWKNQESWDSWLVGFWSNRYSKMQKILPTVFLFLSRHYGFTNYIELSNMFFLILYQEEFQPIKYLLSRITNTSRNIKQKNKFSFLTFSTDFLWFCLQKLWNFEGVVIKCPKQFLRYIELICSGSCKKNSSVNFVSLVGFQTSKLWMIFWKTYCGASFEIIFRQKYFRKTSWFWIL